MGAHEPVTYKEPEELYDEYFALSPRDKKRLTLVAKKYAAFTKDLEPEDLIQEALMKVFEEKRSCKSDLEVFTFLAGSMRSLANNQREMRARRRDANMLEVQHAKYDLLTEHRSNPDHLNGEETIIDEETERAFHDFLLEACNGCEKTQLVLLGGFDGLRGTDLCETAGVSKQELATIHRRIGRMMDRFKRERSVS